MSSVAPLSAETPKTSLSIAAQEGSKFAAIQSTRDLVLIAKAVDGYLKNQKPTPEEYADRVHALREQYSDPQALQRLRETREGGIPIGR